MFLLFFKGMNFNIAKMSFLWRSLFQNKHRAQCLKRSFQDDSEVLIFVRKKSIGIRTMAYKPAKIPLRFKGFFCIISPSFISVIVNQRVCQPR